MDYKLVGSILLIVGTSIGAGMLGLPIATAQLGFAGSVILLVICWFVTLLAAYLILEVNLWLPSNSNIITMARTTLGRYGEYAAWFFYLLLLYSLLAAYIAGGSGLLDGILLANTWVLPRAISSFGFTLLLGVLVYLGIRSVDYANRGLMVVKLSCFIVVVLWLLPYTSARKLFTGAYQYSPTSTALMVTLTSFGFAPIVPSLRVYFAGNVRKLKIALLIGSLIPLFCYIAWDLIIMGLIPLKGEQGLLALLNSNDPTSSMMVILGILLPNAGIRFFVNLFTSICMITSFLAVALCLTDFLADGLRLSKDGLAKLFIHLIALLPPLITVLYFPGVFIRALRYAGIYCVILLILMPVLMVWRGRYQLAKRGSYQAPGGKILLIMLLGFCAYALLLTFFG